MNETHPLQKILTSLRTRRYVLFFALAFLAGCLCTGFLFFGQRSFATGILDKRYNRQHERAAEIIGRLEADIDRERELNRQLREHNNRARDLAEGLTNTAERNVRNLQDAIGLIAEIRAKIKVLADFYDNSDPGDSGD